MFPLLLRISRVWCTCDRLLKKEWIVNNIKIIFQILLSCTLYWYPMGMSVSWGPQWWCCVGSANGASWWWHGVRVWLCMHYAWFLNLGAGIAKWRRGCPGHAKLLQDCWCVALMTGGWGELGRGGDNLRMTLRAKKSPRYLENSKQKVERFECSSVSVL